MEPVLLDVADGIARLTLNRPDAANSLDLPMARGLLDAARALRHRDDVRVVLLRGAGARFCAGGDVPSFAEADDPSGHIRQVTLPLHDAISLLSRLDAPIVASVQGSAAGAGLGLVLGADLVLAAASTKFVMAYTAIGLTPDGSSSWYLPRIVGLRRAVELTLTNRVLTAAEAESYGIVTRTVADEALDDETEALVRQLAVGPTRALGAAKRLLAGAMTTTLESHLATESEAITAAAATADGREGLASFREKRKPSFLGR
ncbi:MAG: enoyl-CoA hydratase-related protein [Ilumatobacteraceae bacterium]